MSGLKAGDRIGIGIVGYGFVGRAIEAGFSKKADIYIRDIAIKDTHSMGHLVRNCEVIFVAVPTPFNVVKHECDTTAIDSVLGQINQIAEDIAKYQIVVIKSAIPPLDARKFQSKYRFARLIVSPEYLSEKDPIRDFINQQAMILGGDEKENCERVVEIFNTYSICNRYAKIGICTLEEAALLKYMENTFLALKVVFMNEYHKLYTQFGFGSSINFNRMLRLHHLDKRMWNEYPYQIPGPDGHFGFGGKCLPKDLLSIVSEAEKKGVEMKLLKKAWELNLVMRSDRNWEFIPGGVNTGGF